MADNITWDWFQAFNENTSQEFEILTRQLFKKELMMEHTYAKANNPGIEVEPILTRFEGKDCFVSFQSKYFKKKVNYNSIEKSIDNVIKYYSEKLNCLYLYCNQNINKDCNSFFRITEKLQNNHIELVLRIGDDILDAVRKCPDLEKRFFSNNVKRAEPVITYGQNVNPTKNFVGRTSELKEIQEKMKTTKRILITGIGGMGKSELLKMIYQKVCEDKSNTECRYGYFEYKVSLKKTICEAMKIYDTGDIDADFDGTKLELEKLANQGGLKIFIDDFPINNYGELHLLDSINGNIIISSRQNSYENYETITIGRLELDECCNIFLKESGITSTTADYKLLRELVQERLGRHTLTVKLLAKITRNKQWTMSELINKLSNTGFHISYINEGKKTNLLTEYEKLYSISNLNNCQKNIMEGFSILREIYLNKQDYMMYLSQDAGDEECDELSELIGMGWIEKTDITYQLHPVFSEFVSESHRFELKNHQNLYNKMSNIWSESTEQNIKKHNKELRTLISFAKYSGFIEPDEIYAIAKIVWLMAEYASALSLLDKISKDNEGTFIKAQLLMAEIHVDKSMFSEAKMCLDNVSKFLKDGEDEFRAEYKILYAQYVEKTAKSDYERRQAIEELKSVEGLNMTEITRSSLYNCLGGFYTNLYDRSNEHLETALYYHQKAKEIRERHQDINILDIARTYNNIGNVYFYLYKNNSAEKKYLNQAELYYNQSLTYRMKALNENHPYIARIYVNLGNVYLEQEDYQKALKYMHKGLEIRKKMLGETTKEVAITYMNLMETYGRMGDKNNLNKYWRLAESVYDLLEIDSDKRQLKRKHYEELYNTCS